MLAALSALTLSLADGQAGSSIVVIMLESPSASDPKSFRNPFNSDALYYVRFPENIPPETAVPGWAYENVTISNTFNVQDALQNKFPESSATRIIQTLTSLPTSSTSPVTSTSSSSSGSGSNTGAISGSVVGGVAAVVALSLA